MEETVKQAIKDLLEQGFFRTRNGSVEVFFDDISVVQKLVFRRKRRKRENEELKIYKQTNGKATGHYDRHGELMVVEYETEWVRPKVDKSKESARIGA